MSDVEKFWQALAPKFGCTLQWNELNFMEQQQFIQGINMILSVVCSQQVHTED